MDLRKLCPHVAQGYVPSVVTDQGMVSQFFYRGGYVALHQVTLMREQPKLDVTEMPCGKHVLTR